MEPKEILKKARIAKGYTQEMIADKVGISHRMYQRYEEGKFPKFKSVQIKKLDRLLGTGLNAILYGKTLRGKKSMVNEVIRIKDQELGQVIGKLQEDDLSLEATTRVILKKVATLYAKETGESVEEVKAGFLKEIEHELDRLFSELKKKSG